MPVQRVCCLGLIACGQEYVVEMPCLEANGIMVCETKVTWGEADAICTEMGGALLDVMVDDTHVDASKHFVAETLIHDLDDPKAVWVGFPWDFVCPAMDTLGAVVDQPCGGLRGYACSIENIDAW